MLRNFEKIARAKVELEQINAAILAVLQAQSYRMGSRSVTKADLATLYKRKEELEDLIDAGNLGRFKRVVPVDK